MDHDALSTVRRATALLVLIVLSGCASNPKTREGCEFRATFNLRVVIENGAPTKVVDMDTGEDASALTVCRNDKVKWIARQRFWIWFYENDSPSNQTRFQSGWNHRIGAPIRPDARKGNYGYGVATSCESGSCKELDPVIIVRD